MINKTKVLSLLISFAVIGCELEVDNPNSLLEDDLADPSAAVGVANGAWNASLQGIGYIMIANAVATDEVVWIGSRDAWRELDKGGMENVYNEFVDGAWPYITEGRWMSDKAVSVLEDFQTKGTLPNTQDLVRSYLTAAMVRVYIADMFDDFVFSDKTVAGDAIGAANMSQLYDEATALLGKASALADAGNKPRVVGLQARVAHAKAVWGKVNPVNTASPYVNAGATEAAAALALMTSDYKWKMKFSASTVFNEMSWEINGRLEMDLLYNDYVANGDPQPNDLVTGTPDSRITALAAEFRDISAGTDYAPITIVSAREMHLIIAESKMAGGDAAGCLAELNKIRTLDELAAYTTEDAGTALQAERRANLFIQGRRLSDMYRFGATSVVWDAVEKSPAGTFFPITIQEIRANPNLSQ
ncbi:MAG: hypothetical protein QF842_02415 [Candidatus Marinimicrobia bacterium]|jgi:hypothetical protein|nr:hypothetical protein [Candidatus Neomarinimicrobiota bacterium]MDP6611487.1 hypothetical protein [Candidatus Neomarinimicrobiota bacterium]|tara:strand:- start:9727 stop:10974 length:1248 start_codon:yes stop_codon:yes gene_type:complete